MATKRLTRPERRAETRERLLEAAGRVFAARGFHPASVDEVAEEAGFTTGALYSNFSGKDDLFLALLDANVARHVREVSEATAERLTVEDRARGAAAQWMAVLDREPELVLLFMEFWSYAVRDEEVRPRFAERWTDIRSALAALISDGAADLGLELTVPAEDLATAADALANGFAIARLVDPEAVPEELFGTSLSLLLAGASAPAVAIDSPER